jgi:hypothetical protein
MDDNTIAVGRIAGTIPDRKRKTQPVNYDRVPAFNCLLHRDALLTYVATLPAAIAARVWLTDVLGTEDLGLSRACDLLDPILPCFVKDPNERQHILDETRDRIRQFADSLA